MSGNYSAGNIQVLEGLEAVRKRPAMYIGSTDINGLHHLVYEIIDNSIDEALAGNCDTITVIMQEDNSIVVEDNGRGIPVDIHPTYNRPALEIVLTKLHAGGKFDNESYKVSGGLHGVGMSCVNALSKWLKVEVKKNGKQYSQSYQRGVPDADMKEFGKSSKTGTRIEFLPDDEIFEVAEFNFDTLAKRFRELAFLNAGVKIIFEDHRTKNGKASEFFFKGGIVSFVQYLCESKKTIMKKPIYFKSQNDDIEIEVAIEYIETYNETMYTYANNINTREGGTHLAGFKSALTRVINDFLKREKYDKKIPVLSGDDVREGLVGIISVKISDPQFEGQTKMKLGNSEVKGMVESATIENLTRYFEDDPQAVRKILEKCIQSARARMAAKKARDLTRRKNALEGNSLPGKLSDCSERAADKCEIFIVEGDSAGGSAKQGRDRQFQAILPLKGKILNVEKARLEKILSNEEIRTMITAFGAGIGEQFDPEKLRYHKIIIMTDADVDGSHIRTLLLTFFFRYMPNIIRDGYLYIAQPPLYSIKHDKKMVYVYTEEQKDKYLGTLDGVKIHLQRYKGLGEMNPEQLWETTLNPENRILLKVNMDDEVIAEQVFSVLMGDAVEPRRKFIEDNAALVENLDL
ncbi:MAG: DNA topoisomerase (ATP-hydrolyzing) subunit B [Spirochaetes bacterium]|jgi:DNA gyrase subunit B|nr:DNA topoisomerase (ATP-hydrolyzing) subunit B [Spirochaetota bacterium]